MTDTLHPYQLTSPEVIQAFLLAGDARVTLRSKRSGTRFTFRLQAAKSENGERRDDFWFVSVLTGADNEADYTYLGQIAKSTVTGGLRYWRGKKSVIGPETPSANAFEWFTELLFDRGVIHPMLEIWHEGRCGVCARPLTDPESIAAGFGPVCRARRAGHAGLLQHDPGDTGDLSRVGLP